MDLLGKQTTLVLQQVLLLAMRVLIGMVLLVKIVRTEVLPLTVQMVLEPVINVRQELIPAQECYVLPVKQVHILMPVLLNVTHALLVNIPMPVQPFV